LHFLLIPQKNCRTEKYFIKNLIINLSKNRKDFQSELKSPLGHGVMKAVFLDF
jgi:hypothetical protein